jgi:hypothetical protein
MPETSQTIDAAQHPGRASQKNQRGAWLSVSPLTADDALPWTSAVTAKGRDGGSMHRESHALPAHTHDGIPHDRLRIKILSSR